MPSDAPPMTLTLLLFAGLRQAAGASELSLAWSGGELTPRALKARVAAARPELATHLERCRVAVDHEFVGEDQALAALDRHGRPVEIALIPPVSGGHDGPQPEAKPGAGDALPRVGERSTLSDAALSLAAVVEAVDHRGAGGIATFTGNVREHSRGKTVRFLEYEAYAPMAVATMDRIAFAVEAEIPGARVALAHRVGHLEIGETAVVIAASAPHRAEAFTACREVIERLKQDVPIWKREVDTEGAEWIGQGP